jgi:LacI family transcriptional regulator
VSAVVTSTQSTARISEATRSRILEAMAELRYRPDLTARSLKLQKSDSIGFYNGHGYIDLSDPFAPSVFTGMQAAAARYSNNLLLYNGLHLQPQKVVLQKLLSNKTDGVLMGPPPADAGLIAALGKTDKPVIQLAESYPGAPSVSTDDYYTARQLAEHLVERGHKAILFRRGEIPIASETARFSAFQEVAEENGVTLIATNPADRYDRLSDEEQKVILRRGSPRITAIACWHDASAIQTLRFLDEHHLRCPGDFAVTGFDGFDWPELGETRTLTTAHVDWPRIASACIELLVDRIRGGQIPERTVVNPSLKLGNTT